jgi:hypothetical protein
MREIGKKVLVIVLVMAMMYSFVLSAWTYIEIHNINTGEFFFTGHVSSGKVNFCINDAPSITTNCDSTAVQGTIYSCKINATDNETGSLTVSYSTVLVNRIFSTDNSTLPFNITLDGNISFTPTNDDVGNYTYNVMTNDLEDCSNSESSLSIDLEITNINDAPVLDTTIPDVEYYAGETIFAYSLNDFFSDPDTDSLTYTVAGNTLISVTIGSDGLVRISSATCGIRERVIFTAMDPYNETADSNLVTITCTNTTNPITEPNTGTSSGGSSGGGGGSVPLCKPEFECFEYHRCNITNQRLMRCVDKEGCDDEEFVTLACQYSPLLDCNETWSCGEWGQCFPNSTQYRTCTDSMACGTQLLMPPLFQECEYIGTCSDGIKNCHDGVCEEGIDCGGSCNVCQSVQVPYPFEEEGGIGIYLLTGLILAVLSAILIYHYFRKEINSALAKAGWYITKRKRKQILLSKEDQKKLLEELEIMDKKLLKAQNKQDLFAILNKDLQAFNYYLNKVLEYNGEFDAQKLTEILDKKKVKIIPTLRTIYKSTFSEIMKVMKNENLVNTYKIKLLIEEVRNIVLQTSTVTLGEYSRDVQEFKPQEHDSYTSRMTLKMTNIYIALQFLETDTAKKRYLELLADYEKIGVNEESVVFDDVRRLYENISYVNGWSWREKP